MERMELPAFEAALEALLSADRSQRKQAELCLAQISTDPNYSVQVLTAALCESHNLPVLWIMIGYLCKQAGEYTISRNNGA